MFARTFKTARVALCLGAAVVLWAGGSFLWEQRRNRRIVSETAVEIGVPPELLLAVAKVESGFRSSARSPKGALGIMQVMPETGREVARRLGLASYDLADPHDSALIGGTYLQWMLARYGGEERLALAAYHAGPSRVDAWLAQGGLEHAFGETRRYVSAVLEERDGFR